MVAVSNTVINTEFAVRMVEQVFQIYILSEEKFWKRRGAPSRERTPQRNGWRNTPRIFQRSAFVEPPHGFSTSTIHDASAMQNVIKLDPWASRHAESRLQQICCLGLEAQVAMPLILRELHAVVASRWNGFFWCNPNGDITNLFTELPEALTLAPLYYQEFYNSRELEVFQGWRYICRHVTWTTPFEALLRVPRRELLRHPFHGELLSRIEFQTALYKVVRERERPLGIVALHRAHGDPAFSADEARRLDRLAAFIRHALTDAGSYRPDDWVDPSAAEEGLIVADARGTIRWLSDNARRMLVMASCERLSREVRHLDALQHLNRPLLRLVQCVENLRRDLPSTSPPSWVQDNAWGRFRFHAHPLNPTTDGETLVGISVRHQRPLPVKLMQQIERLRLPPRRAQVCLLMASGQSYGHIAGRLGVAESTVISHARAVYNRVDARNRGELINKLLAV
jgi:DNA-binding CsgD family transcriptional regulator